jgi:hypothetical protein
LVVLPVLESVAADEPVAEDVSLALVPPVDDAPVDD